MACAQPAAAATRSSTQDDSLASAGPLIAWKRGDLKGAFQRLTLAGGKHAAHQHLGHLVRPDTGPLDRRPELTPYQLVVLVTPAFGPLVRDFRPSHAGWMIFQASVVVAGGFISWLWLLSRYPVATVASLPLRVRWR